jgi:hypothetical protein
MIPRKQSAGSNHMFYSEVASKMQTEYLRGKKPSAHSLNHVPKPSNFSNPVSDYEPEDVL